MHNSLRTHNEIALSLVGSLESRIGGVADQAVVALVRGSGIPFLAILLAKAIRARPEQSAEPAIWARIWLQLSA